MTDESLTCDVMCFGGGIQSTAMLIANCLGLLPKRCDFAVFADPGFEPAAVYQHVTFMQQWAAERGTPVISGHAATTITDARGVKQMPLFLRQPDGSEGQLFRQCTGEYKISVINKVLRTKLGYKPRQRMRHHVVKWIGISRDEAIRMKPATEAWAVHWYPLIEALDLTRHGCRDLIERYDVPMPVKSACLHCPYHSHRYWAEMKRDNPQEFAQVVEFDRRLRAAKHEIFGEDGLRGEPYIHRSRLPLDQVDLNDGQPDLFGEECEGLCGV